MQLNYSQYMEPAIAGARVDLSSDEVGSYVAENAIQPGFGIVDGTIGGKQVKMPAGAVTAFRGIALLKSNSEQDVNGLVQYKAKDSVSVLEQGRAWVPVKGAVAWDADVYLIHTGADAGKFTSGVGANQTIIAGAKFKFATTGDGLSIVKLK